ncbi:unnamed protein product [Meganyctiphanes norvegica]|uniref:Peptidase S1 domain-containing protein n=1 Tax=Meganyctiphanes norvegica TaxID=48144 RepID=A0AAV2PFJ0_MEGNR
MLPNCPKACKQCGGAVQSASQCKCEGSLPVDAAGNVILQGLVGERSIIPCSCKPTISSSCQCVAIQSCCDVAPTIINQVNPRTGAAPISNFIIDATDRQNSKCSDILSICCDKVCPTTKPKPPTTIRPTAAGRSRNCGIRNAVGDRVTIINFEDNQAQVGEFPWMVAVLDKTNKYIAGASLVHSRAVLTAAHKVHEQVAGNLLARIGDWDLGNENEQTPLQNINVERIVLHKDFNRPTLINDVALLILQRDADLSNTVMPICLPQPHHNFVGSECIVTGWGKDVFGTSGKYQQILKKVSVPAVSNSECQNMLRRTHLGPTFKLDRTFNCAGGKGEDACTGDGGSPLVCQNPDNKNEYVQMGVVAWGIGCGKIGNPGVYGSIPATVDWINQNIPKQLANEFDVRGLMG